MRRLWLTLMLLVALPSTGLAGQAIVSDALTPSELATIEVVHEWPGPERVAVGELLILRAPEAERHAWSVWPGEARYAVFEGGTILVVETRVQGSRVLASASLVDGQLSAEQHEVVVGEGPGPDPPPPPPPPPTDVLWVLVVEESSQRTPEQAAVLVSPKVRAWFAADEDRHWRLVDRDVLDEHGNVPEDLARWIKMAEGLTLPRVFLINETGGLVDQVPLPATPEAMLDLLKQYVPKGEFDFGFDPASGDTVASVTTVDMIIEVPRAAVPADCPPGQPCSTNPTRPTRLFRWRK